jgi:hypothetical protein
MMGLRDIEWTQMPYCNLSIASGLIGPIMADIEATEVKMFRPIKIICIV